MLQAQAPDRGEKDHYGRFEVEVYARAVGATSFDGAEGDALAAIGFVWVPNGFTEASCRKFLSDFKSNVEITAGP